MLSILPSTVLPPVSGFGRDRKSSGSGHGPSKGNNPASNTGLNSQNLDLSLDWIQFISFHESKESLLELIQLTESVFSERLDFSFDKPIFRGCRWEGHGGGLLGAQVCWNPPSAGKPGRALIILPGRVCRSADFTDIHDYLCACTALYDAYPTRLDVALDDYDLDTAVSFAEVAKAALVGNFSGCRKENIHVHLSAKRFDGKMHFGASVVFGSPSSDARLCYYDKQVESAGEQPCYRWEGRYRDFKAQQIWNGLVEIAPSNLDAATNHLASIVTGTIRFLDRKTLPAVKNLERLSPLAWWVELVWRVGSFARLAAKRQVFCIERTITWLYSAVAPTLAVLEDVLEGKDFRDFIRDLRESGRSRHTRKHKQQKEKFFGELYGIIPRNSCREPDNIRFAV